MSAAASEREPFVPLPRSVLPTHYSLSLLPDLGHYVFDGVVDVTLTVSEENVTDIKLNAADLVIHSACVRLSTGEIIPSSAISTDADKQELTISLPKALPVNASVTTIVPLALTRPDGTPTATAASEKTEVHEIDGAPTVTLSIAYTGYINDKLCGLYRSSYTVSTSSEEQETRIMACSQFEAVDARRCLPCWDEPALKATFSVSITAPKHLTVVSNMPEVTSKPEPFTFPALASTEKKDIINGESAHANAFFAKFYPHGEVPYVSAGLPVVAAPENDDEGVALRAPRCDNPALLAASTPEAVETALGFNGRGALFSELVTHTFAATPKMSTYLLTFVIGEFDTISETLVSFSKDPSAPLLRGAAAAEAAAAAGAGSKPEREVLVRVLTMPGTSAQGQYALDVTAKSIMFFENWFRIPFPLPKLDCIAIPDFLAGAMEGFGCITYRETLLLLDPASSSKDTMQEVCLTVSHEVSHQWFGNLVTMEWWTHLWLNEGFATWANYLATDAFHPEFEIWTQFLHSDLASALSLDALASSHAIEVDVGHPEEVDEIFDAISYSKGCAVIRMLSAFLGPQDFQKGLRTYLQSHLYGNASTGDLWRHLEAASGQPVERLMEGWTRRVGFPVLTVTSEGTGEVQVKQTRFLSDGSGGDAEGKWVVPVLVTDSSSGATAVRVLDAPQGSLPAPEGQGKGLLLLNLDGAGCYRVAYPEATWRAIAAAIREGCPTLTGASAAAARVTLASDAFALARAGTLSAGVYLELLMAILECERSYHVWASLSSDIGTLLRALAPHPEPARVVKQALAARAAKFVAAVPWAAKGDSLWGSLAHSADADSSEHLTPLFKQVFVGFLEDIEDPAAEAEASDRVRRFFANKEHIVEPAEGAVLTPDVRGAAYRLAAGASSGVVDLLFTAFTEAPSAEEKDRIASAFASVRSDADADRVMATLLTSLTSSASAVASGALPAPVAGQPVVRSQDVPFVMKGFGGNPVQLPRAWESVKRHWDTVIYPEYEGSSALRHAIGLVNGFATDKAADEVEAFFASHSHKGAEQFVKQCVERIRTNARFGAALVKGGAWKGLV